MEPAIKQQRPHVCGPTPFVPPVRPASLPKPAPHLPETRRPFGAAAPRDTCYSLSEAFEARVLPLLSADNTPLSCSCETLVWVVLCGVWRTNSAQSIVVTGSRSAESAQDG